MNTIEVPTNEEEVLFLAENVAEGLRSRPEIAPIENYADALEAKMLQVHQGRAAHDAVRNVLVTRRAARREARRTVKDVVKSAYNIYRGVNGTEWGPAWEVVGAPVGHTELPTKTKDLLAALKGFASYLTANPGMEAAALGFTATRMNETYEGYVEANGAVNAAKADLLASADRKGAVLEELRTMIRVVRAGLQGRRNRNSELWSALGFKRPGSPTRPEIPGNLQVVENEGGVVTLTWDRAVRGERFWVYAKGPEEKAVPTVVARVREPEAEIPGLTPGVSYTLQVVAVNAAGPSVLSEAIAIVVNA